MIIKLKKQEEEINELIETWEEYQNAPKHFNVPLPDEILTDDCKFYNDRVKRDIDDFKLELEYLKEISKIYNENDFIVTEQYHMGNFYCDWLILVFNSIISHFIKVHIFLYSYVFICIFSKVFK